MKVIHKIDEFIAIVERYLILFILLVMMGLSSAQVILRNVAGTGIAGADIFNRALVIYLTFLAASLTTHLSRHILIDTILVNVSPFLRCVFKLFTNALSLFVCILFLQGCFEFIKSELEAPTDLIWGIPQWAVQIVFVYGFGMMIFRFALQWIDAVIALMKRDFTEFAHYERKAH